MDKGLTASKEEARSKTQELRNCLKLYVECEHMTRATKIVEEIGLEVLLSDDGLQTFEINFHGLLNALVCNDTSLSIISSEKIDTIKKVQTKMKKIRSYLEAWLKGKLTYNEYYNMRIAKYPAEIQILKDQVPDYRKQGQEDQHIRELVNNVERREIEEIYGSAIFTID